MVGLRSEGEGHSLVLDDGANAERRRRRPGHAGVSRQRSCWHRWHPGGDQPHTIGYAGLASVTLRYPAAHVGHPVRGTGFLVPPTENHLIVGCSWLSSKWPHLADRDAITIKCLVGRYGGGRAIPADDQELVRDVHEELARVMGIQGGPPPAHVKRWPAGMPQYTVGHSARLDAIASALSARAGIWVTGPRTTGWGSPAASPTPSARRRRYSRRWRQRGRSGPSDEAASRPGPAPATTGPAADPGVLGDHQGLSTGLPALPAGPPPAASRCRRAVQRPGTSADRPDRRVRCAGSVLVLTGGDCLLRSDLFELIGHATASGLPVALAPAVSPLLSAATIEQIAASGVRAVSISLDGAAAATHDGIRGVPGHHADTLAAIRALAEAGVTVQVNTTVIARERRPARRRLPRRRAAGAQIWEVFFLISVAEGKPPRP